MQPGSFRRWFDRNPDIAKSVSLLETFSDDVLSIMGDGLSDLIEQCRTSGEISFDPHRRNEVLKHAMKKQREEDASPQLWRLVNDVSSLPEEGQDIIGQKLHELIGLIYDYLSACQRFFGEQSFSEVRRITTRYVNHGRHEAETYVAEIQHALQEGCKKFHA